MDARTDSILTDSVLPPVGFAQPVAAPLAVAEPPAEPLPGAGLDAPSSFDEPDNPVPLEQLTPAPPDERDPTLAFLESLPPKPVSDWTPDQPFSSSSTEITNGLSSAGNSPGLPAASGIVHASQLATLPPPTGIPAGMPPGPQSAMTQQRLAALPPPRPNGLAHPPAGPYPPGQSAANRASMNPYAQNQNRQMPPNWAGQQGANPFQEQVNAGWGIAIGLLITFLLSGVMIIGLVLATIFAFARKHPARTILAITSMVALAAFMASQVGVVGYSEWRMIGQLMVFLSLIAVTVSTLLLSRTPKTPGPGQR